MRRVEEWIEDRDGAVDAARRDREIARIERSATARRRAPDQRSPPKSAARARSAYPRSDANSRPQLELPFLSDAGRSDLRGPTQAPPGRLRHVQLTTRVIPYWFRRARRRTIGIVVDERGVLRRRPALGHDRRDRGVHPREGALGAEAHRRGAARSARALPLAGGARLPTSAARSRSRARSWAGIRLAGPRLEMLGARLRQCDAAARVVLEWLRRSALALYRERVAALGPRSA